MGVIESPTAAGSEKDDNDDIWQAKEWKDIEKILLVDRKPQLKHEYVEESDSQIAWVLKDITEEEYALEYKILLSCYGCNNLERSLRELSEFESSHGDDEDAVKTKRKESSAIAQKMFKPGDKVPTKYQGQNNEKANHVANYITNKWPMAAFGSLKANPSHNLDGDMRATVLMLCFRFIKSSWVIDKKKKLEVLKDKQGLDWYGLTESVLSWAKEGKKRGSKNLIDMAEQTKMHLDGIMNESISHIATRSIDKSSTKAESAEETAKKAAIASEAEKEAIRIRRDSMRARMRGSATSLASLATVPPPPPPTAPTSVQSHIPPRLPPPPPPPIESDTSYDPKRPRWNQYGDPTLPPPTSSTVLINQSINPNLNRAPSFVPYHQQAKLPLDGPTCSDNIGRPVQQRAPSPYQDPRRVGGQPQYEMQSSTGPGGYAANFHTDAYMQQPPRNEMESNEQQQGTRSRWENSDGEAINGRNNKRTRDNGPAPRIDGDAGVRGRGRGRGIAQTRPAWMSVDDQGNTNGPTGLPDSLSSGSGRAVDRSTPGWLAQQDGGQDIPSSRPPPLPPNGGRPPFPVDDGALGRGRGRGRTLPAWMTNQQ